MQSTVRLPQLPPFPIAADSRRITFHVSGSGEPGVNMSMLKDQPLDILRDGVADGSEVISDPIVLWTKVSATVSLRISFANINGRQWAGYEGVEWDGVRVSTGGMERAEIAQKISGCFERFINHVHDTPINPNFAAFRVGDGGVTLDRLVLLSLACMVDDLWIAEVDVLAA
ncbi:hypothetical protein HWV62_13371 [Athelia sp. TMB]|nr:hypothetical protein HWV62_13371 [Athelia sp. TMB]